MGLGLGSGNQTGLGKQPRAIWGLQFRIFGHLFQIPISYNLGSNVVFRIQKMGLLPPLVELGSVKSPRVAGPLLTCKVVNPRLLVSCGMRRVQVLLSRLCKLREAHRTGCCGCCAPPPCFQVFACFAPPNLPPNSPATSCIVEAHHQYRAIANW